MNDTALILIIIALAIIACVIAFNIYQENKFRNKVRSQFSGSQEDALLNTSKNQVRDPEEELLRPVIIGETQPNTYTQYEDDHFIEDTENEPSLFDVYEDHEEIVEPVLAQEETHSAQQFIFEEEKEEIVEEQFVSPVITQAQEVEQEDSASANWLLDLNSMSKLELPWFDKRVDYLAYVSLAALQELPAAPRLSNRKRYKIAGCTANNRFQEAEAIPGVQYQAFVLGLQAIDRNGLANEEEMLQFKHQATAFAREMNAGIKFTDTASFLEQAHPIDALCEEVDKVIAIHLVSRSSLLGTELKSALEATGFELEHDGAFYYYDDSGSVQFTIATLNAEPFTAPLLAKQAYRGFSMLFSVALVKNGEKAFNQFMDIAVNLSSQLHLDLVDDNRQELSTRWLKDIRSYVVEEQQKMVQANIIPGQELAQRLFS